MGDRKAGEEVPARVVGGCRVGVVVVIRVVEGGVDLDAFDDGEFVGRGVAGCPGQDSTRCVEDDDFVGVMRATSSEAVVVVDGLEGCADFDSRCLTWLTKIWRNMAKLLIGSVFAMVSTNLQLIALSAIMKYHSLKMEEINDWLRGKTVSGQTNAVRVSETHTCNGMGCDES